MADILIKGLHLPKDWEMLSVNINKDGKVILPLDLSCKQIAEAVIVPSHGRLIDADELAHSYADSGQYTTDQLYMIIRRIISSPTVIEASGSQKNE